MQFLTGDEMNRVPGCGADFMKKETKNPTHEAKKATKANEDNGPNVSNSSMQMTAVICCQLLLCKSSQISKRVFQARQPRWHNLPRLSCVKILVMARRRLQSTAEKDYMNRRSWYWHTWKSTVEVFPTLASRRQKGGRS